MESPGTPNHKKSRKTSTQKNIEKQYCKKSVHGRILTPKGGGPFRGGNVPKSQKSEPWAQKGPLAPKIPKNHQKMSPRASKITQNHENLVAQKSRKSEKKDFKKLDMEKTLILKL